MRLTRKIEPQVWETFTFPKYDYNRDNYGALLSSTESVINKLGQLEDTEEELGIDLIILFRALKNGIVDKKPLGKNNYALTLITPDRISIEFKNKCLRKRSEKFYFKDYGKTWALTKEELL